MNTKTALEITKEMETEVWQMVSMLRESEIENNPSLVKHLTNLLIEISTFGDLLNKRKGEACLN